MSNLFIDMHGDNLKNLENTYLKNMTHLLSSVAAGFNLPVQYASHLNVHDEGRESIDYQNHLIVNISCPDNKWQM